MGALIRHDGLVNKASCGLIAMLAESPERTLKDCVTYSRVPQTSAFSC